jgi:hypothetical protein
LVKFSWRAEVITEVSNYKSLHPIFAYYGVGPVSEFTP